MAKTSTLLLAVLLDSPALYRAFVTHDMAYTTALTWYLVAVVVAALMLSMLRSLVDGYRRANDAEARQLARAAAREAAREAAQERALDALDAARANPAVMAQARRSTDGEFADEPVADDEEPG